MIVERKEERRNEEEKRSGIELFIFISYLGISLCGVVFNNGVGYQFELSANKLMKTALSLL